MKEINIDGVFLAPFAGYVVMATVIFIPLRLVFDRFVIDRWVWHRSLFDVSIFVIILAAIGLLSHG